MALRDQPYIPLYVQDFLTDEKLSECSASATGVYIRIMCLMHKNESYGKILLKQKFKQTSNQIKNFASQIAKNMPYDFHTVASALEELVAEKVLLMDGDTITQKRMVKDNEISESRARTGKLGGEKTQQNIKYFAKAKAKAKVQANSENENEGEFEDVNEDLNGIGGVGENPKYQSIINSTIWVQSIAMQKRLMPDQVLDYLGTFLGDLILKDDFGKTERDIKKHFVSWLNIQLKDNKKHDNKKNIGDRTQPGGFGSL